MASLCHRDSPGPYRPVSGCPSDQMNSSALSSPGSLRLLPESLQGGHIMNLLWNHLVVPASNVLPLWPLSWSPQGPPLTAEVLPPHPLHHGPTVRGQRARVAAWWGTQQVWRWPGPSGGGSSEEGRTVFPNRKEAQGHRWKWGSTSVTEEERGLTHEEIQQVI